MEFWFNMALGALVVTWALNMLVALYHIEKRLIVLAMMAQGQVVALDLLLQGLRITPDKGPIQAVHKSPLVGRDGGRLQ